MKKRLSDALLLTTGTLLVSFGVYFFKFPNNFSTGGVSGISVILGALLPGVSTGTLVLIINAALLLLGFAVFGRSFGLKTVYCSMLMSLSIYALERLVPMDAPLTTQPMLELVFSVLLPAVGSAILFNLQGSTGGTDIVAMIFRKYTDLDIGKALFCTDFLIATLAGVVFGIETGLFSLLGLLGLVGMNIKNAVVLVEQIGTLRREGRTPREALVEATRSRIVPVVSASGTTVLGMLPLLFDSMFGAMAATIMGGLLAATLLTILVLPVVYALFHKIRLS